MLIYPNFLLTFLQYLQRNHLIIKNYYFKNELAIFSVSFIKKSYKTVSGLFYDLF